MIPVPPHDPAGAMEAAPGADNFEEVLPPDEEEGVWPSLADVQHWATPQPEGWGLWLLGVQEADFQRIAAFIYQQELQTMADSGRVADAAAEAEAKGKVGDMVRDPAWQCATAGQLRDQNEFWTVMESGREGDAASPACLWHHAVRWARAQQAEMGVDPQTDITALSDADIAGAFHAIDRNGDGVLTRAEIIYSIRTDEAVRAALYIDTPGISTIHRSMFDKIFEGMDEDHSRDATLAEFSAEIRRREQRAMEEPSQAEFIQLQDNLDALIEALREARQGGAADKAALLSGLEELADLRRDRERVEQALAPFFEAMGEDAAWCEARRRTLNYPCREGRRADPNDLMPYTLPEFEAEYGEEGAQIWDTAERRDWEALCADFEQTYPGMPDALAALRVAIAPLEWSQRPNPLERSHEASPSPNGGVAALADPGPAPAPPAAAERSRQIGSVLPLQQQQQEGGDAALLYPRERWLEDNAQAARLYYGPSNCCSDSSDGGGFWRFAQEFGVSPGFRLYFTGLLFACCCVTLIVFWHSYMALMSRLFVPARKGVWASIGVLCLVIISTFTAGAWATQLSKCVNGWVYLDDEDYYADTDFRGEEKDVTGRLRQRREQVGGVHAKHAGAAALALPDKGKYNVPAHLAGLVSPAWRVSLWGLPCYGCFRRESWLFVMWLSTTLAPFMYAVCRAAAENQNVADAVAHFTVWNLAVVPFLVVAAWLHAWFLAARLKRRQMRGAGGGERAAAWNHDPPLLCEWGLDQHAVARNLGALGFSLLPPLIMWWVTSRREPGLSVPWVVIGIATTALMLAMREAVRDVGWDGTAARAPYVALSLLLVFVTIGVVGAAHVSGTCVAAFVVCTFATQALLLRHSSHPHANHSGGADGDRELREMAEQRGYRLTYRITNPKRWMPCSEVCSALAAVPCCGRGQPAGAPERGGREPARRRHWRLPPHWYDDPRRAASSISAPLLVWVMSTCFLAAVCFLAFAAEFRQPSPRGLAAEAVAAPSAAPSAGPAGAPPPAAATPGRRAGGLQLAQGSFVPPPTTGPSRAPTGATLRPTTAPSSSASNASYPVCRLRWGPDGAPLTVVDLALLADLSAASGDAWVAGFTTRFAARGWALVRRGGAAQDAGSAVPADFGEESGEAVGWVHVYHAGTRSHVILPRSNLEGVHLQRDLDIWGESMSFRALSVLVPLLRTLPDRLAAPLAAGLGMVKHAMDGEVGRGVDAAVEPLLQYALALGCAGQSGGCATPLRADGPGGGVPVRGGGVTFAGHGTDGGVARLAAARLGLASVTFGAPGTGWVQRMSDATPRSARDVSVVAEGDPVPAIDTRSGAVQRIRCTGHKTMQRCHRMRKMLCELRDMCPDPDSAAARVSC